MFSLLFDNNLNISLPYPCVNSLFAVKWRPCFNINLYCIHYIKYILNVYTRFRCPTVHVVCIYYSQLSTYELQRSVSVNYLRRSNRYSSGGLQCVYVIIRTSCSSQLFTTVTGNVGSANLDAAAARHHVVLSHRYRACWVHAGPTDGRVSARFSNSPVARFGTTVVSQRRRTPTRHVVITRFVRAYATSRLMPVRCILGPSAEIRGAPYP